MTLFGAHVGPQHTTPDELRHQFGTIADFVRPGVLTGSDVDLLDRFSAALKLT